MSLVTDSLTIPPASSLNGTGKGAAARQLPAAASRAVVPLVYGEDRFSGLTLNVLAAAGTPGTLLVQVLWCFACDSINDVRLNDEALPAGATITHYTGAQTTADAALVAAFAAQGITGVLPLTGFAWSLLAMPAALFDGQINVTARVRGRRCYDPAFDTTAGGAGPQRLADPSTWAYTDIPAVCLGDFVSNTVYGCGQPVNWESVRITGAANRAIVPASSEQRRLVGVSFSSAAPSVDVAETLRAYAGCFLLPGPTGVRLLPDANDAPVASYSHAAGEIASISSLDLRDLGQAPTAVEIIYTDTTAIPWRDASAIAQLAGAGTTRPWRLSQVRMPGIHRYSQAMREAVERLNKLALNDLSTSLEVFDIGVRHDKGDIITVTHPLGLAAETLRVNGVSMPGPGRWQLELVKHAPAAYSDTVATVAPTVDGSRLLPIAPPADVAGLVGVVSKGIITWSWTAATERFYTETRLRLGGADWAAGTPLWAGRGNSLVQQVAAVGTYVLRARHVVIDGQQSEGVATATVTVEADDLDASAPDLTPPPTPDDPTLTAGFATVMLEQDAPDYIQGHGHGTTKLYGKVYTGGALPVFADAAVLAEFPGTAYAYSAGVGVTLRLWITWVTRDGVESLVPAGGTNGFAVTTSKVGTSDLGDAIVLSQNLAPGSVTADKALLDIGGDNLLANNSFELDTNVDGVADGWATVSETEAITPTLTPGRISGKAQRLAWTGASTSSKSVSQSNVADAAWGVRGGWLPGRTYVVSFYARADSAKAVGQALLWPTQVPASTVVLKNPNLATTWQRYAFRITWGETVEPNCRLRFGLDAGAAITGWIELDDAQVEEGDTLSGYQGKLATNTIVAGDGAIAKLAVTNALIADLAVDDAKMANVSVAKLLADSLSVGSYIQSGGYVPGTSGWRIHANGTAEFAAASIRGQLTASQIDSRGLTIRKADGTIILDAGASVPIPSSMVNPAAGWLNSNVTSQSLGIRTFKVRTTGGGGIHPEGGGGICEIRDMDTNTVLAQGGVSTGRRSYVLFEFDKASFGSVFAQTYDVFGGGEVASPDGVFRSAADMAADLNYIATNRPGNYIVIRGFDEPRGRRFDSGLATAMYRCGASPSKFGSPNFPFRAAYILIGRAGIGQGGGVEFLSEVGDAAGAWADLTMTWAKGALTVTGAGAPRSIGDYGYTGDLNATNGATIGANLFGSFTQATWDVVMSSAYIKRAHIDTGSFVNLAALTAWTGTLTVDAGGYLRGGQTDWATGDGFFLGWSSGAYKLSIGNALAYLRWSPANGLELKLDAFTASISGGPLSGSVGNGDRIYGSRTVSVTNGTAPYTYNWALVGVAGEAPDVPVSMYVSSGIGTATATISGSSTNNQVHAYAQCTVVDVNGRSASAGFNVLITHGTYIP